MKLFLISAPARMKPCIVVLLKHAPWPGALDLHSDSGSLNSQIFMLSKKFHCTCEYVNMGQILFMHSRPIDCQNVN